MFNDVYKKDFIEVTGMKAHWKMRKMRVDPYPDTVLHRGLNRKEVKETTDPILEEAMLYSAVVGMEMLCGLADIYDSVDRMVLEQSERKVEVNGAIVWLHHQMGRRDDRLAIVEDWKADVTEHMRDIGEAQGGIWGRLSKAEAHLTQLQVIVVEQSREIDLLGGVVAQQLELLGIHWDLILRLDQENRARFERVERMLDPRGQTFGNPILIDLDPEEDREVDVVTLVEHE